MPGKRQCPSAFGKYWSVVIWSRKECDMEDPSAVVYAKGDARRFVDKYYDINAKDIEEKVSSWVSSFGDCPPGCKKREPVGEKHVPVPAKFEYVEYRRAVICYAKFDAGGTIYCDPKIERVSSRPGVFGPTLLAVFGLLLALALFAPQASNAVGSFEGQGTMTYAYTSGTSPIDSVSFNLPGGLAQSMTVDSVSSGFVASTSSNQVTASGGTLSPGQSLSLKFHFNRYVDPGTTNFTSTATTANGQTLQQVGTLTVRQMTVLKILSAFLAYQLPLALLGLVGVGAGTAGVLARAKSGPGSAGASLMPQTQDLTAADVKKMLDSPMGPGSTRTYVREVEDGALVSETTSEYDEGGKPVSKPA